MLFLSRRWKPNKWPFYVLVGFEGPLTVALLALFGIANPDTYRTKLWQFGADEGFNSSPLTGLYAAANYRPYTTPKVWSQFITDFNVVISVLSMFILLVKSVMYMLHVFPPILSVLVHALLICLYAVSVDYQASSDTTDPEHPQNGPPWYITKSCSVANTDALKGYCRQAKASFACTCAMLGVFVIYFAFAVYSCFPSRKQREEYAEKRQLKADKWAKFETVEDPVTGETRAFPLPDTPGLQDDETLAGSMMTPRTMAFGKLGGIKDLPLRNHFSTPKGLTSPTTFASSRSPDPAATKSPVSPGFTGPWSGPNYNSNAAGKSPEVDLAHGDEAAPQLYFPPPPKTSKK